MNAQPNTTSTTPTAGDMHDRLASIGISLTPRGERMATRDRGYTRRDLSKVIEGLSAGDVLLLYVVASGLAKQ